MRKKSLSVLAVALSLAIVSPSVYAGSQEPPIGPTPGPLKAPVEKEEPAQPKPSNQSGQKRILEPPFDLSLESSAVNSPKPSDTSREAKSDTKAPGNRPSGERSSSEGSLSEPNQSGPIGKRLKPVDSDSKSAPSRDAGEEPSTTENSGLRLGLPVLEPKTAPRIVEAKPVEDSEEKTSRQDSPEKSSDNQPQGREAAGKAGLDGVTANTGKGSSDSAAENSESKTTDSGKEPNRSTEITALSTQNDDQLPRTKETPMPKTASHGPLLMIVGLLTATFGWVGRKISSSKG